jgi:hypothetical protein
MGEVREMISFAERVRFYMETEPSWTIRECEKAAQDDIDEERKYAHCID